MTGSTGLLGRQLVRRWQARGFEVVALVRDTRRARARLGDDIRLHSTQDPGWMRPLRADLIDCDAIVNLAGEGVFDRRWSKRRKRALRESRVDLTQTLVSLLRQAPRRPRVLVSASAVGIYGNRGDEELDECSAQGQGFLADLCRDWEDAAMQAHDEGLRVVTLRTGVVLSKEGGALAKMLPSFRAGVGGRLGNGQQYLPWIHEDDVLAVIDRAVSDDSMFGAYNLVAPEPVRQRDFASSLGIALGRSARFAVPQGLLSLALGERSQVITGGQRALPARLLEKGHYFQYPSLDRALAALLSVAPELAIGQVEGA